MSKFGRRLYIGLFVSVLGVQLPVSAGFAQDVPKLEIPAAPLAASDSTAAPATLEASSATPETPAKPEGTGVVPAPSAAPASNQVVAPPTATLGQAVPPPSAPDPSSLPSLNEVLGQTGTTQETPAPLPPGMDLPIDESVTLEKTKEEKELELRKKAYDAAINGIFPMKPDEIRKLLEVNDETRQAVETPLYPSPNPESVFATVSLDPGAKPLVIKTAVGNVTTLSMVDASGQPWPIRDLTWAGNFEVLQPESGSNMLRITPMSEFAQGNVSLRVVGLNPPIILVLRADRENVHVRIDVQVPEMGPNGVAPLISGLTTSVAAGDGKIASVLEGVAPPSAKKLLVNGVDGRTSAYDLNGMMYVRTPYTLLSPAWSSSARSADGTNVYALASTPVLLLSDKGKMVRAFLSGEEPTDGQ